MTYHKPCLQQRNKGPNLLITRTPESSVAKRCTWVPEFDHTLHELKCGLWPVELQSFGPAHRVLQLTIYWLMWPLMCIGLTTHTDKTL